MRRRYSSPLAGYVSNALPSAQVCPHYPYPRLLWPRYDHSKPATHNITAGTPDRSTARPARRDLVVSHHDTQPQSQTEFPLNMTHDIPSTHMTHIPRTYRTSLSLWTSFTPTISSAHHNANLSLPLHHLLTMTHIPHTHHTPSSHGNVVTVPPSHHFLMIAPIPHIFHTHYSVWNIYIFLTHYTISPPWHISLTPTAPPPHNDPHFPHSLLPHHVAHSLHPLHGIPTMTSIPKIFFSFIYWRYSCAFMHCPWLNVLFRYQTSFNLYHNESINDSLHGNYLVG